MPKNKNNKKKNSKKKKALALALSSAIAAYPVSSAIASTTSPNNSSQISSTDDVANQAALEDMLIDEYIDNNINAAPENIKPLPSIDTSNPSENTNPESYSITKNATFETKTTEKGTFVNIPDINLRRGLNENLKRGPIADEITPEDMATLTGTINLGSKGIKDLTGLNAAVNATKIDLISNTEIKQLPNGIFNSLTKLTELNLAGCGLTEINNNAFVNLPLLTTLRLDFNNITYLPENMLSNLKTITFLKLNDNKLTSLTPNAFAALPNISVLILNNNQISNLLPEHFRNLTKLTNLYLSGNLIENFSSNIFPNPSSIVYIELMKNSLTSINDNSFSGLTGLQQLLLEKNKISSISANAFVTNTNLINLNLKTNLISNFNTSQIASLTKLTTLNLSENTLKDVSSLSSRTTTTIDATGQKFSILNPVLDNKYDLFTLNTNLFSDIKGFSSPLSTFEGVTFKGPYGLTLSQDKSSASFRYDFMPNQNTGKIAASYSLTSPTPLKHTYSATVEVPISRDLSLINYINSTLEKNINDISLTEGDNLKKIKADVASSTPEGQKYIQEKCPIYLSKIDSYIQRNTDMHSILSFTPTASTNRESLLPLIDLATNFGASQCVEVKTGINSIFSSYLDLIKSEIDKYPIDSLNPSHIFPVRAIKDDLTSLSAKINKVASKDNTIVSQDIFNRVSLYNNSLTPLLDKIGEIEFSEAVSTLKKPFEDVINVSVNNLSVSDATKLTLAYKNLHSSPQNIQDAVINSIKDFNSKIPPLLERSQLISSIKNYSEVNSSSYESLQDLVDKAFTISQSQKLQLSSEISSIFTMYVNLFELDINKFTLDNIEISNKDEINKLTDGINSLYSNINLMNKESGVNIISSSTSTKTASLIGKLKSLSMKIEALEKESAPLNAVIDKVTSFISSLPNELSLNDAINILSSTKDIESLSDDNKLALLDKFPDIEKKMPGLLERAQKILDIKNYAYVSEKDKTKIDELIKSSIVVSFNQRSELSDEINSIFNLRSNILRNDVSLYTPLNVKVSDKEKILLLKDESSKLLSSLKTVNSPTANVYSNLLASEALFTDASKAASTRIVTLETENKINSIQENITALLNKISDIENGGSQGSITPPTSGNNSSNTGGSNSGTSSNNNSSSGGNYYPSTSFNSDKLAQTGNPLASLVLTLGSASLLAGGYALFRRKK